RQADELADRVDQIGAQAVFVMPLDLLASVLVLETDIQPGTEHRLCLEHMLEAADGEFRRIEVFRVGPEMHAGTGIAFANAANDLQLAALEAIGKMHAVLVAIALDGHLDTRRKRVDYGNPDPMQATGKLVVLVGKLAASMKLGEDQLDARNALFRVDIHRHAAAIVDDLQ